MASDDSEIAVSELVAAKLMRLCEAIWDSEYLHGHSTEMRANKITDSFICYRSAVAK